MFKGQRGPLGCPETSAPIYQSAPRNIPRKGKISIGDVFIVLTELFFDTYSYENVRRHRLLRKANCTCHSIQLPASKGEEGYIIPPGKILLFATTTPDAVKNSSYFGKAAGVWAHSRYLRVTKRAHLILAANTASWLDPYPSGLLWLLYVLPGLKTNKSTFCPHSTFVCFVWI